MRRGRWKKDRRLWVSRFLFLWLHLCLCLCLSLSLSHTHTHTDRQSELPDATLTFNTLYLHHWTPATLALALPHILSTFQPQDLCTCLLLCLEEISFLQISTQFPLSLYSHLAASGNTSLTSLSYLVASILFAFFCKALVTTQHCGPFFVNSFNRMWASQGQGFYLFVCFGPAARYVGS